MSTYRGVLLCFMYDLCSKCRKSPQFVGLIVNLSLFSLKILYTSFSIFSVFSGYFVACCTAQKHTFPPSKNLSVV